MELCIVTIGQIWILGLKFFFYEISQINIMVYDFKQAESFAITSKYS